MDSYLGSGMTWPFIADPTVEEFDMGALPVRKSMSTYSQNCLMFSAESPPGTEVDDWLMLSVAAERGKLLVPVGWTCAVREREDGKYRSTIIKIAKIGDVFPQGIHTFEFNKSTPFEALFICFPKGSF